VFEGGRDKKFDSAGKGSQKHRRVQGGVLEGWLQKRKVAGEVETIIGWVGAGFVDSMVKGGGGRLVFEDLAV